MKNLSKEAKVALTVIVSIVVGFLGYRSMQDLSIFRQATQVETHFDRVDGLSSGNYIYLNGVKVGSVHEMELVNGDSVRVTLGFDPGVEIPRGSIARLESSGLMDEKAIVIQKGDSDEMLQNGERIDGEYMGGISESIRNQGDRLSNDLSESMERLNRLLEQLNETVNEQNRTHINSTLGNLESSTGQLSVLLDRKREDLESSITHANRFLGNLDTVSTDNRERIDSIVTRLDSTMLHMERVSSDLNTTTDELNTLLEKINNGDGTLGRMVHDESLYNNSDSLAIEMRRLIKNINDDPNKFLKNMRLIEIF